MKTSPPWAEPCHLYPRAGSEELVRSRDFPYRSQTWHILWMVPRWRNLTEFRHDIRVERPDQGLYCTCLSSLSSWHGSFICCLSSGREGETWQSGQVANRVLVPSPRKLVGNNAGNSEAINLYRARRARDSKRGTRTGRDSRVKNPT